MKNKMKRIMSLVLLICMMAALTAGACADYTVNGVSGQAVAKTEVFSATTDINSYALTAESRLPSGMQLSSEGTKLYVSGTPGETGTIVCRINVTSNNSATVESTALTFSITAPATPAPVTPTPTPKPTAAPTASPKPVAPKITKQPTGETVKVGGRAVFIAKADNAKTLIWRIVSADTTNTYTAEEAPYYFKGLTVDGLGTEKLILNNIPSSMSGWSVECKFVGDGGTSFSNGARISVTAETAPTATNKPAATTKPPATPPATSPVAVTAPVIDTQPKAADANVGEAVTLSASAHGTDGVELSYQWYSAGTDNLAAIAAISGATSGSYTPPQTAGTKYYCVGVTGSQGGVKSPVTYSQLVAVKYTDPSATPSPSPTVPVTPQPAAERSIVSSLIFFGVLAALAVVALIVVLILVRRAGKEK